MTKFYPLVVRDVRRETHDCVSVSFDVPTDWAEKFTFVAGQYLTLRADIEGEDVRRSYSICAAPTDGDLRVAVKRVSGGTFSTFAATELKAGDTLKVMPPQGKFLVKPDPKRAQHYVGIAAGSGITPIISIMRTVLGAEANSHFTLIYGNRAKASIIFREALESLKNEYMSRLTVHHVLSREKTDTPLLSGRINAEKCSQFFTKLIDIQSVDAFYLCGPETMIFEVKDWLEAANVRREAIHFELFTASSAKKQHTKTTNLVAAERDKVSHVTVCLDGLSFDFDLPYYGETILDAATDQGADMPFSCKGGVCCTCRARVLEGEVEMAINYALEPDEVAAGYILTCQSQPRSERLVVDFDV